MLPSLSAQSCPVRFASLWCFAFAALAVVFVLVLGFCICFALVRALCSSSSLLLSGLPGLSADPWKCISFIVLSCPCLSLSCLLLCCCVVGSESCLCSLLSVLRLVPFHVLLLVASRWLSELNLDRRAVCVKFAHAFASGSSAVLASRSVCRLLDGIAPGWYWLPGMFELWGGYGRLPYLQVSLRDVWCLLLYNYSH